MWIPLVGIACLLCHAAAEDAIQQLLFVCPGGTNDLLQIAQTQTPPGVVIRTFDNVTAALGDAKSGDGLLLLASDDNLKNNVTTEVSAAHWMQIHKLSLNTYIEFPASLPESKFNSGFPVRSTFWERVVVTASEGLGTLPKLSILHPHKLIKFVALPSAEWLARSHLVFAKVAGYDTASDGLPSDASQYPLLVKASPNLMVATTQLCRARTRRFAPTSSWIAVTQYILDAVRGPGTGGWLPPVHWTASVTASYSALQKLPADAEAECLRRGVEFYRTGKLLPDAWRAQELFNAYSAKDPPWVGGTGILPFPGASHRGGDGQLGVLEGFSSDVDSEGGQPQATSVRNDCTCETAAAFAARYVVTKASKVNVSRHDQIVATNLLNYAHLHSGFSQPWVVPPQGAWTHGGSYVKARPWVATGDVFGVLSWTTGAYDIMYKDDNARSLLGAVVTAALLGSERWHSTITTAVLGNLRLTTRLGFGFSSGDFAGVSTLPHGWRSIYNKQDSPGGQDFSPHYTCYIWAVYLWAYEVSGFTPLLERAQAALEQMMANYPSKWIPTSNGIAMQRARIILPLAFLVRVNDTALHRQWLRTAVDGLLSRQACGPNVTAKTALWCTFTEELSASGWGGGTRVPNNDDYGEFEAPLNQENTDPVSDLLYTINFAFLGLHEAAAATGDKDFQLAEDMLASFLVRVQASSTEHPELDGAFFRAFDYKKWEVWASDADIGWGAWSVETGWTQSWITTVMGLRLLKTSLWELGTGEFMRGIKADFDTWAPTMFYNSSLPPPASAPCLNSTVSKVHQGMQVNFTLVTDNAALCAPAPGSTVSHVIYTGFICDGQDHKIRWDSMRTVDPRAGLSPAQCEWSRKANPGDASEFLGGCGTGAAQVLLPAQLCSQQAAESRSMLI